MAKSARAPTNRSGNMKRPSMSAVYGLALNPDGTLLAAAGPGKGIIFDTASGNAVIKIPGATGHAYDVDFAPDSKSVVICFHGGHVRQYDVQSGDEIASYTGHAGVPQGVRKVKFSPDGKQLASVAEDSTLRIWDTQSTDELQRFKARADVNTVAWGPGESHITFATDVGLHTVEIASRRGMTLDTGAIADVQVVNNQILAAWDEAIRFLTPDLEITRTLEQCAVSRMRAYEGYLFAASWSGADAGVHRWDLSDGTRQRLPLPAPVGDGPHAVWALAIDAARGVLYAGCNPMNGSSNIVAWDCASLDLLDL
ncbi:hypothetical protein DN745_10625 [Bradymonas sediminis]|uniref:Uncharacterized protein n=2 Tax=Bradymonas sediminis TaxID=1548548 RepID=A0A2Z4FLY3_9DELT|nr:hypothetical protein DN745_10625 [Bradymonas sediminis]